MYPGEYALDHPDQPALIMAGPGECLDATADVGPFRSGQRSTVGDVGYVDEDGYLYLTDRKTYMIISGA